MKLKFSLITFLLLMFLAGNVNAADFTPQGNINLRDIYNITGAPYVNATLYYGNGSQLTGVIGTANSSGYWDNMDTINTTQMEDNGGTLNILVSWVTTLWNTIFGTKTTDDLTEGSTNLYDNQSWNETLADILYADISLIGDNSSWNESLADTIYYGIANPSGFYNSTDFVIGDYSTTADILVFGYYNASDFVITDYFTKSDVLSFGYYNSSDFDIANYFTSAEVLAFSYYNSSDFSIADYFTSAEVLGFSYYNSTDFVITDYYTLSQIDGFSYYNATDFSIGDYYTSTQTDTEITNANTSMKTYVDETFYLDSNPSGYWNDTYATFNKTYADELYLVSQLALFFYNSTDSFNSSYTIMNTTLNDGGTPQIDTYASLSDGDTLLTKRILSTTQLTLLQTGAYDQHTTINYTAGTKDVQLKSTVHILYVNGTETQIGLSPVSDVLTPGVYQQVIWSGIIDSETIFATGDYLTMYLYAVVSGGGSAPTIDLVVGGSTAARFDIGINPQDIILAETDPLWTANQSSYSTTATIWGWNYYNSTDFSISDYFTKTNILNFGYYNSTDFSISDYPLISALVGLLGNWSADKGDYWNASLDLDTVISADEIAESKIEFTTACASGNHLYISGNDLVCEVDDIGTDTNASTACSADEVLLGNGSCLSTASITGVTNLTNVALTNISEVFDFNLNISGNLTIGSGTTYMDLYFDGTRNLFDTLGFNAMFTDNVTADYYFGYLNWSWLKNIPSYVLSADLVGLVGNWTADKSSYWDTSNDLDTVIDTDEITELKIDFNTVCGTGNHLYVSGNNLACEADDTGGDMNDLIDDTTPQLGGTLDANGNNIGATDDEIENIYIGLNNRIYFGDGQEGSIYYNGTSLIIAG